MTIHYSRFPSHRIVALKPASRPGLWLVHTHDYVDGEWVQHRPELRTSLESARALLPVEGVPFPVPPDFASEAVGVTL